MTRKNPHLVQPLFERGKGSPARRRHQDRIARLSTVKGLEWPEGRGYNVWPEGIVRFETMYHTTVALRAVLREGLLPRDRQRKKSLALGGGDQGEISLTPSLEQAQATATALRVMVLFAQSHQTLDDLVSTLHEAYGTTREQDEQVRRAVGGHSTSQLGPFWMLTNALTVLHRHGVAFDPVFASSEVLDLAASGDPDDVGVVRVVIDTQEPNVRYNEDEEEWTVKPNAIVSVERV